MTEYYFDVIFTTMPDVELEKRGPFATAEEAEQARSSYVASQWVPTISAVYYSE